MKKLLTLVVAAIMIMSFAVAANAADISVTLNGEALVFEQAPVIVEGRTLVPLRAIFEALGASVEWNGETKTVTSVKDDITVKLTIGSNTLYKNDEAVELDVPAQIVGAGYTMVPARAIAESFGVLVDWDDSTKTVILVKEEVVDVAPAFPEGTILKIDAEHYTDDIGFYGLSNDGPQIVDNPDKPGDKVFFFETTAEGSAYNYMWYDCEWVPGETYLIQFRVRPGVDCYGNPLSLASIGANVKIGADKGVGGIDIRNGGWNLYNNIYTVPADADTTKTMKFGVFATPAKVEGFDTNLAWSFYIDDITIVPYKGPLQPGRQDQNLAPQNLPYGFNVDTVKGYDIDLSTLTGGYGVPTDAGYHFNKPSKDPIAYANNLNLDAGKYSAVAVKFEMYGVEITADNRDRFELYFSTTESKISEENGTVAYYTSINKLDDGSYVVYLDVSKLATWNGTITSLRFDPGNTDAGSWLIKRIVLIEK